MTDLELIRQKCIKANPDAGEIKVFKCEDCGSEEQQFYRPIRLADILLAIQKAIITFDIGLAGNICYHWNLRDDSLDEQSPETLKFLASLLEDKSNR